jgi:3-(3-hydroxy-phenyl)propionate hydroxylase
VAEHGVVIAGGGPTGLMLAAELALARVDVAIVERRPTQDVVGSRSGGLQSRTIEILDQRGVADRFLSQGQIFRVASLAHVSFDRGELPSRHNYGLALRQSRFEEILAGWVGELEVPIYRGRELTDFAQRRGGVDVEIAGGESVRAQYLVGCDGGRSLVRKAAGIDFPGWDPSVSSLIAEVELRDAPEVGVRHDDNGTQAIGKLEDEGRYGIVVTERYAGQSDEPTLRDLSSALIAVWGTDYGARNPTSVSRFTDMARQAATYRKGRVLLAGDAAHVHYPIGGQGLNLGVQDAVNLGWKLAQVVHGTSSDGLLDTYEAERHPVAARVLQTTLAQAALTRSEVRIDAVRDLLSQLLRMDEPRAWWVGMISGLDIHYDLGEGHPLLGRRMPDLDVVSDGGPLRVFSLLHDGRPVLLNLGEPGSFESTGRVRVVDAAYDGSWELPVIGSVPAPAAVLIRPDGHVAWVEDGTGAGLADALTTWFG